MLHDVRFVNGRHFAARVVAGILQCTANDLLGARDADRLDRDARLVAAGADGSVGRELVDRVDQLAGRRLGGLELDARVQVLGVLAHNHQIDGMVAEESPHTGIILARADAGEQAQFLAQVDVDAAEAGAHRRGDGGLQGALRTADARQGCVRQGRTAAGHHVQACLLNVPLDCHAGRLDTAARRLGQFRSDAVAGNQRYFVSHKRCYPVVRLRLTEITQANKRNDGRQRSDGV